MSFLVELHGDDARMRRALVFASMLLLAGCASTTPSSQTPPVPVGPAHERSTKPAGEVGSHRGPDVGGARYDDSGRPLASPSVTLAPAEDRFATKAISSAPPPPPARPPRVGKRNIVLHNARIDNAMRMLAKVGRFNLVVQGEIADTVSVDLKGVEPYDAALAIAESKRVTLRYRDGIVIVSRSSK